MRENHLKFTQKEKEINMVKFQMLLKKTMKMLQEKNWQRHKQWLLNQVRQKQQLFTQGKEKNFANKKWQKTIRNCCYISEKFNFDPEEILDKSLLFDLKKTSKKKIFDSILKKNTRQKRYVLYRT